MKKISTLIIGLGQIGLGYDLKQKKKIVETHYRSILYNKNFTILGLIDKDINKIKLNKKNIINFPIFNNLNQFKKNVKEVDLIIISTPTTTHFNLINQVLKIFKPKIIFCEKPFCKNLLQAKKIVTLCKKNKIKLYINYLRRNEKKIIQLKKLLVNKRNEMEVLYSKDILTNACHFIDLSIFYFGQVKFVKVKKNKTNKIISFKLYFNNAEVTFKKVSKKNKYKNSFSIRNNSYQISQNKNLIFVESKTGIKKFKKNNNLMFENSKELFKAYSKKKILLANGKNGLDVHHIINRINLE